MRRYSACEGERRGGVETREVYRASKTGAWRAAVVVTRLALVADEEIFQQLLGFMGVAVLHGVLWPHCWGAAPVARKWDVGGDGACGGGGGGGRGAAPRGIGVRRSAGRGRATGTMQLLQERAVDVLEARAFGEDVGAARAGGVGAADEGGRERRRPAHEGTGEVGADLRNAPTSPPPSEARPGAQRGGCTVRLPEAVV